MTDGDHLLAQVDAHFIADVNIDDVLSSHVIDLVALHLAQQLEEGTAESEMLPSRLWTWIQKKKKTLEEEGAQTFPVNAQIGHRIYLAPTVVEDRTTH